MNPLRFLSTFTILAMIFAIVLPAQARVPNDFLLGEQWYLEEIWAAEAWDQTTGDKEVIVAVLDSGMDTDHPDLAGNLWVNEDEIYGDGIDNDRNGFIDDIHGWDFLKSDPNPQPNFSSEANANAISHGTLVAGIIGAVGNNYTGVSGLAWNVNLMPLRIIDEYGVGSSYDVRKAIEYAVNNGADIINLSFTATETDFMLYNTLRWAHEEGVVIVTSVGNENADISQSPVYPACYDLNTENRYVIGVGATNQNNQKAEFSNYGAGCVDVTAPGTDMFGTLYNSRSYLHFATMYGGPYEGTSIAAPIVSGVVALMKSVQPDLSPYQVDLLLRLTSDALSEDRETRESLGAGRVNAWRAVDAAVRTEVQKAILPDTGAFFLMQFAQDDPLLYLINNEGEEIDSFRAYPEGFEGEVRFALSDADGDENKEVVVVPGEGGGPQVRVLDLNGLPLNQFFAFEESDRSGLLLATADVNADGAEDIAVVKDGGTEVRLFTEKGEELFSFEISSHQGAKALSLGQLDEDEQFEVVVLTEANDVWVYEVDGDYERSFTLPASQEVSRLVVADIDEDEVGELLLSAEEGSRPFVWVYSAIGQLQDLFLAYASSYQGGVSLQVGDIDGNGEVEIYTAPTSNGGPHVRIFNKLGDPIGGFFAIDETKRLGVRIAL